MPTLLSMADRNALHSAGPCILTNAQRTGRRRRYSPLLTKAIFQNDGIEERVPPPLQITKLHGVGVEISMDGRGSRLGNIDVERFWKTRKYEDLHLNVNESARDLKQGLKRYFRFDSGHRFHQNLDYRTPNQMYDSFRVEGELSAA